MRGFVAACPIWRLAAVVVGTSYRALRKRRLNLQRRSAAWVCAGIPADHCTYHGAELWRRADDAIMTTQNASSSDNILDHAA